MNAIVVHYKELALKGRNRPWFIQLLVRNLKTALAGLGVRSVRSIMGRIEIELANPEAGPGSNPESPIPNPVSDRLRCVFGIANFSYAGRATHDFAQLAAAILADVGDRAPASFRVAATRADGLRSRMATFQPATARTCAVARPMPRFEPAPVMIAVLSDTGMASSKVSGQRCSRELM